jgi:hydroxymethylpyrimidine pyrophosphatase-like HAD family hydrolase
MNAYIFDVDGVITNPKNQEVINPVVFEKLITLLQQGIPLSFITGRGMHWLHSNIIKDMEKYIDEHLTFDKRILDLLYISGEFGAATTEHINGISKEFLKKEFEIPTELKENIIQKVKFFDKYLYIEKGKQTIVAIRIENSLTQSEIKKYKNEIVNSINTLLINYPEIEILSDRLSINIRFRNANKKFATDECILWIKKRGYAPDKYYVFGDSPSDLEMGEELENKHLPFDFIFVGEKSELDDINYSFPVIFTKKHCDEGLLEYLETHDTRKY